MSDIKVQEEFNAKIGETLSHFQQIEDLLKDYIEVACERVRSHLPSEVAFGFSVADYRDSSLEGLFRIFKKLNGNLTLQTEIQRLIPSRNFVAHRAALRSSEELKGSNRDSIFHELYDLDTRAIDVLLDLSEEINSIRKGLTRRNEKA